MKLLPFYIGAALAATLEELNKRVHALRDAGIIAKDDVSFTNEIATDKVSALNRIQDLEKNSCSKMRFEIDGLLTNVSGDFSMGSLASALVYERAMRKLSERLHNVSEPEDSPRNQLAKALNPVNWQFSSPLTHVTSIMNGFTDSAWCIPLYGIIYQDDLGEFAKQMSISTRQLTPSATFRPYMMVHSLSNISASVDLLESFNLDEASGRHEALEKTAKFLGEDTDLIKELEGGEITQDHIQAILRKKIKKSFFTEDGHFARPLMPDDRSKKVLDTLDSIKRPSTASLCPAKPKDELEGQSIATKNIRLSNALFGRFYDFTIKSLNHDICMLTIKQRNVTAQMVKQAIDKLKNDGIPVHNEAKILTTAGTDPQTALVLVESVERNACAVMKNHISSLVEKISADYANPPILDILVYTKLMQKMSKRLKDPSGDPDSLRNELAKELDPENWRASAPALGIQHTLQHVPGPNWCRSIYRTFYKDDLYLLISKLGHKISLSRDDELKFAYTYPYRLSLLARAASILETHNFDDPASLQQAAKETKELLYADVELQAELDKGELTRDHIRKILLKRVRKQFFDAGEFMIPFVVNSDEKAKSMIKALESLKTLPKDASIFENCEAKPNDDQDNVDITLPPTPSDKDIEALLLIQVPFATESLKHDVFVLIKDDLKNKPADDKNDDKKAEKPSNESSSSSSSSSSGGGGGGGGGGSGSSGSSSSSMAASNTASPPTSSKDNSASKLTGGISFVVAGLVVLMM